MPEPDPRPRRAQRTRAEERADEIDISPTKLLADIEALTRRARRRAAAGRRVPRRAPARARRVPQLQAADGRGARARSRPRRRGPHPQGARPRRRLRPRHRGTAGVDRRGRLVRGHRGHRPQAAALLESEGVTAIDAIAGHAVRPARARGDRQRPRHGPARGRDRRGGPARLPAARPRPPAGPRGRRRRRRRRPAATDTDRPND